MKREAVGNTQIVEGGAGSIPLALAYLEEQGLEVDGNPDIYARAYRHFGIDEAREIREKSASRAFGARRAFVIAAPAMTNEAQNALLKTLEEAPNDALFILIVPSPHALLPTLRSRAQMLTLESPDADALVDAKKFLAANTRARLEMLEPLLEKGDDDKRDIASILRFLSSLEALLSKRVSPESRESIRAVYRARAYAGDKGALLKPLLEQVALLVHTA